MSPGEREISRTERVIELEGVNLLTFKRVMTSGLGQEQWTEYSADGGATWHRALVTAYKVAQDTGKLVVYRGEATEADDEFQSFMVVLITALKSLEAGETLKIFRGDHEIMLTKETAITSVRASVIRDAKLGEPEEEEREDH